MWFPREMPGVRPSPGGTDWAVAAATAVQANRSLTRWSARCVSSARCDGESCSRRRASASSSGCRLAGPGSRHHRSPRAVPRLVSRPVACRRPCVPRRATRKPSYRRGRRDLGRREQPRAYSSSGRPAAKVTRWLTDSWATIPLVAGDGVPTTRRWTSRYGGYLRQRPQQALHPFRGESALVTVVEMRPGTRGVGPGRKRRVSTPSGTMCTLSGRTRKSRQMSRRTASPKSP